MFDATLSTFALVNTINYRSYSINVFLSVVKILGFLGDRIHVYI